MVIIFHLLLFFLQNKRSPNLLFLAANSCMGALFLYTPKNEHWTSSINTSLTALPKYLFYAPTSQCAEGEQAFDIIYYLSVLRPGPDISSLTYIDELRSPVSPNYDLPSMPHPPSTVTTSLLKMEHRARKLFLSNTLLQLVTFVGSLCPSTTYQYPEDQLWIAIYPFTSGSPAPICSASDK